MRASIVVALAYSLSFGHPAAAQTFPTHPITMIVPFAAGGPADVVGRILAKHLSQTLPVIVENIGGAGGNLGTDHVARSEPDGYTLLFQNISMAISPSLYKKLQYDPLKDFDYIGLVAYQPNVILTGPSIKAGNFGELESYLASHQSTLTIANSGTGGASYLCAILFMNALKLHMTSVPYRGTSQAMTDLLGGQVDLLCDSVATATPYIDAGKVKAFGVTSPQRFAGLPQVPALSEEGLPGFNMVNWTGLYAPKGTPAEVLAKLRTSLAEVISDPSFKSDLERIGSTPFAPDHAGAEALAAYLKSEMQRWSGLLKEVALPPS